MYIYIYIHICISIDCMVVGIKLLFAWEIGSDDASSGLHLSVETGQGGDS